MYLNGEQITNFGTENYPPQNTDLSIFNGNALDLDWTYGSELFESYLQSFILLMARYQSHTDFKNLTIIIFYSKKTI